MNILLINYEYPPIGAGAATATKAMAKEFALLNHKPVVVTSSYQNYKGFIEEEGIRVYRIPAGRKFKERSGIVQMFLYILSSLFYLPGIIKKEKIDRAIIYFSFPCGPLGLYLKLFFKIPYIVSLRGGDVPGTEKSLDLIHKILQPIRRTVFKKSIAVIANSNGLKELSEKADPFPVQVVPNGVDTDYYTPKKNQHNKEFQFLFVGRFQPQKNLFYLLDTFYSLKQKSNIPFQVILIGDGFQRAELEEKVKSYNLESIISFKGWQDKEKLREFYRTSDCIINPSLYEGMPNVLLEAMACGLPVIASNVAGNDMLVEMGVNGFLFNLENPEKLIEHLLYFQENPKKAEEFGKISRKIAEEKFSWKSTVTSYLEILNSYKK